MFCILKGENVSTSKLLPSSRGLLPLGAIEKRNKEQPLGHGYFYPPFVWPPLLGPLFILPNLNLFIYLDQLGLILAPESYLGFYTLLLDNGMDLSIGLI